MADSALGPVQAEDIAALAALHREAFPAFFLSQLGEPFLREFYRGFLVDPSAITVVCRDASGQPVGAVVGTSAPAGFYRRLLRRQYPRLAVASVRAAVRRPKSIARLARGALYRGEIGDQPVPGGALLSSICTAPTTRGSGLGQILIDRWEQAASDHGATAAHLSTDASNNARVNAFYRQAGWTCDHVYSTREGRRMNLYTKDLRR